MICILFPIKGHCMFKITIKKKYYIEHIGRDIFHRE